MSIDMYQEGGSYYLGKRPKDQIDLINKKDSGLIKSRNILKDIKEIKVIEFDHNDVVRHPLISKIIQAYQKNFNDNN